MRKTRLWAMIIGISLVALAVSAAPATAQMGVWRDINPDAYLSPPANPQLNSIYMLSSSEGWAVGDSRPTTDTTTALPAIFHYDGSTWNLVPAPKFPDFPSQPSAYNLTSVSFGPPGNAISNDDGWTVGYNGTLFPACTTSTTSTPSITLCPSSGQVGTVVTVSGSGFVPSDVGLIPGCSSPPYGISSPTSTSIITSLPASPAGCTWTSSGGLEAFTFTVGSVAAGPYVIQVEGSPGADVAEATFTVTGPAYLTPTALHWDGITWRVQTSGLSGPSAGPLWAVSMVSSTDAWAVGQTVDGSSVCPGGAEVCGTFWHWTGVPGLGGGWNTPQAPVSCPGSVSPCGIYSVYMVSPSEGWAVGAGGAIFHYYGGVWNVFTSPVSTALRSVFMISPTEGWAVGDGGIIIQYSNGAWSGPFSPGAISTNLLSVFMVSSTEGWAFGAGGTILHYSGGSWTALSSNLVPTSPVSLLNLNSGFFNGASDGWVVGTDGVVLHFDGVNYGTVTSPTINNFTSISFGPPLTGPINPDDGWAVGNASITAPFEPTIYHWNGFAWTKGVSIGTQNNLNSVFMVNTGDVWTVGGGTHSTASCTGPLCPVILHFTGGSWNTITPPPGTYTLKSIFMISSNEGWAVGEQAPTCTPPSPTVYPITCYPTGIILHYTVSGGVGTWAVFPAPSSPSAVHGLNSVFMLSQDEGWIVGDNATILHYTVSGGVGTWNLVTVSGSPSLSPDANLTSIFMLSPTSGWAVGGIKCAWNACGLTSAGPVIIYWDGTKWEPVAAPTIPGGITLAGHTSATLKSVFFAAPNDGWAVGFPGKSVATTLHWDGVSWRHVSLSPDLLGQVPPILTSVYMTSETDGWIVGGSPDFKSCTSGASTCYFSQTAPAGTPPESFGYKTPLSTILRFAPYGVVFSTTSTSIVVSTVSTSTTALTTTISSTSTPVCPPNVTISINVVNNQGNPLSGANVVLTPVAFTPCLPGPVQGVTNSQGLATFTLPPGAYTVALTKNGVTSTQSITVASSPSSGQMFTLTLNVSPGGMIPGFPIESILAGIMVGVGILVLLRRRRAH